MVEVWYGRIRLVWCWCGSVAIVMVTYGGGVVWQNKVGVVLVRCWCGSEAKAVVTYSGGMVWQNKVGVVLWP